MLHIFLRIFSQCLSVNFLFLIRISQAAYPHLIKETNPIQKRENGNDRRHFLDSELWRELKPQCKRVEGKKQVSSIKVGMKRGAYVTTTRQYACNFTFCKALNIQQFTPKRHWNLSRSLDSRFLLFFLLTNRPSEHLLHQL